MELVWGEAKHLALGKQVRAFRTDGKPAEPGEVLKALAKPTGVACFVTHGGRQVHLAALPVPDPFYLALLREGAVVLVLHGKEVVGKPAPPITGK